MTNIPLLVITVSGQENVRSTQNNFQAQKNMKTFLLRDQPAADKSGCDKYWHLNLWIKCTGLKAGAGFSLAGDYHTFWLLRLLDSHTTGPFVFPYWPEKHYLIRLSTEQLVWVEIGKVDSPCWIYTTNSVFFLNAILVVVHMMGDLIVYNTGHCHNRKMKLMMFYTSPYNL